MDLQSHISYIIGVDVGGTNTDAVLVEYQINGKAIVFSKNQTTQDFCTGFKNCVQSLLNQAFTKIPEFNPNNILSINIGTTQFLNALIQRKELNPVSVIRLCGPKTIHFPPYVNIPPDLKSIVNHKDYSKVYLLSGGREINGKEISPLNHDEIKEKANQLSQIYQEAKIEEQFGFLSVVINSVFNNLQIQQLKNHESSAKDILQQIFQENNIKYQITLASEIGDVGLLQREGASIINASLQRLAIKITNSISQAVFELNMLKCKHLFFTENDGNLLSFRDAVQWPIQVLTSGATNSAKGACQLESKKQALVCDIGGSTTDFAIIEDGESQPSPSHVIIGGVLTNLSMPDTYSIAMGGGSIIDRQGEFGSKNGSIALNLMTQSLYSGGHTVTLTDIALANNPSLSSHFNLLDQNRDISEFRKLEKNQEFISLVLAKVINRIQQTIFQFVPANQEIEMILVGGGRIIVPQGTVFQRIKGCVQKQNQLYSVINSYGAALAQISCKRWKVLHFQNQEIHEKESGVAKIQLKYQVEKELKDRGAKDGTIQCSEPSESQFPYTNGSSSIIQGQGSAEFDYIQYDKEILEFSQYQYFQDSDSSTSTKEPSSEYQSENPLNQDEFIQGVEQTWQICYGAQNLINQNEEEKKSQQPLLEYDSDNNTWVWVVSDFDFEAICLGAEYLGSGGGGSTIMPKLQFKTLKDQICANPTSTFSHSMKQIRIMSPMGAQNIKNAIGTLVFSAGSPTVVGEVLLGVSPVNGLIEKLRQKQHIDFIICAEIGGMNGINPLLVSYSNNGLPVIDADSMGRAFPSLNQFTHIFRADPQQLNLLPHLVADDSGIHSQYYDEQYNQLDVLRELAFQKDLKQKCFYSSVNVHGTMPVHEIQNLLVQNSYSRAWHFGKSILEAKSFRRDLNVEIDILQKQEFGVKIFEGTVSMINRRWSRENHAEFGEIFIESLDSLNNYVVCFQNQYLVVLQYVSQEYEQSGKPYKVNSEGRKILNPNVLVQCTTPDIINLLNYQDLSPILIEKIKIGIRVKCYTFPVDEQLRDKKGLERCDPKNFGFDINYVSMIDYQQAPRQALSIFDQYGKI